MPARPSAAQYHRYREAIRGEPLPLALVDLDAVDRNLEAVLAPVRRSKATMRVASKSVRSVEILRYLVQRGGDVMRGIMAFSPAEAAYLAGEGFGDLLVAYPTMDLHGARLVAEANAKGAVVRLAADAPEHLALAAAAAEAVGARVPVVVDVDVSYRPLGGRVHIGVRRSPLHEPAEIADLVERVGRSPHLVFAGLLAYEAHLAGIPDETQKPFAAHLDGPKRLIKSLARAPALELRRAVVRELERRGVPVPLFNGGGTGSVAWSAEDPSLTEVTAGSGFLDSHLFDGYRGLDLDPAVFFALPVTRRPAPGFVTCQGGGFVASGGAGPDRLPVPYLPEGLRLTGLEGAGEVQTPLLVPAGVGLSLGDPVFFRHAKAGELAEHFLSYLLVRGERVEGRAATYRGAGRCF